MTEIEDIKLRVRLLEIPWVIAGVIALYMFFRWLI